MKKIIGGSLIALFACAALTGAGMAYVLFSCPFQLDETTYIYIDETDTPASVRDKVVQQARPTTLWGYDLACWLKGYNQQVRTGRYAVEPGTKMLDQVRLMANGIQTPIRLTVPTTRTVEALVGRVARQLMIDSLALSKALNQEQTLQQMGYTQETLPCLFIPDTYEVYWNIAADKLVQRLQKEHERFWSDARKAKAQALGLTPVQVSTLASIVESESNYGPEKPTIAGLYLNRLHKGMLLQSDPTVIFALHDFTIRRVLYAHLKVDSPYNTYKYAGLPPGPIRIATPQGLDAVLNPQQHNYLYMCAKEDFSGSHNFAANLAQHAQNARRYQQALSKRNIK